MWEQERDDFLRRRVLGEVLPQECSSACRQGLLEVHSLHRYFEREVFAPDMPLADPKGEQLTWPLRWSGEIIRRLDSAPVLCLGHFAADFAQAFPGLSRSSYTSLLRDFFAHWAIARPKANIHINLGATLDGPAIACAEALLELLDAGATLTNPFVVLRIRDGVNLSQGDPLFHVTRRALEISLLRQGIGFSLMDSELNREWLECGAYTGDGVRLEPVHGNLFQGARDVYVNGIVTVTVPASPQDDWATLDRTLYLAARVLAQKLELLRADGSFAPESGSNIINLAGLNFGAESNLEAFAVLERIVARVQQMEGDLGLSLSVAILESLNHATGVPQVSSSLVLEAQRQHQLRGGHSLILPAGAHMSWQDLAAMLIAAQEAGVSFLRFSPADVRCGVCHLSVAASGPCPQCGAEARRRVDFVEGRLQATVTGEEIL